MKRIGIIGAMGSEIELLKSFILIKEEKLIAGRTFYEGNVENTEVILVCSGIGKVNSAMSAQILIDKFNVDAVINTGIAGGAGGVKVRDVVVSTEVFYHDMDKRILALSYPNLESFKADEKLVNLVNDVCKDENINCISGIIATGDQFIDNKDLKDDIVKRINPNAIEMEGGAVAHVCVSNKLPFVVIRCISDNADDSAQMDYDTFEKLAADDAAKIVLKLLKRI